MIFFFKKKIFFCFFPMKISQSLLVSKDGSKIWSSQMWQHFLTHAKHFEGECITQSQQTILIRTCLPFFLYRPGLKHNTKEFFHVPKDESFYEKRQFRTCTRSWSIFHFSFLRLDLLKQNWNKKYKHKKYLT